MGPKKDIVGLWQKAALRHGLRFGVTEHLERSYSWFKVNKGSDKKGPYAGVPYDGNDLKYRDFYFPPHADTSRTYPENPPGAYHRFDRFIPAGPSLHRRRHAVRPGG
jgi:alpha-L-fucosidase